MRNGVLSNNLRQWRKARRLTQTVLAEQAGITRQSIIAIEKGRLNPSVAVALSLAALLNASVEDLFALNPAEALADEGVAAGPGKGAFQVAARPIAGEVAETPNGEFDGEDEVPGAVWDFV